MDKHTARLARQERTWMHAVAWTALAALFLMMYGVLLGWTACDIALMWVVLYTPLFTTRVLWRSRHYGQISFFLACFLLLLGRSGAETLQAWQSFWPPTMANHLELARPVIPQVFADVTILGITYAVQMRMRDRWITIAGGVMAAALVAHTLVLDHPVLAASASLLALVVLLTVFVQQIRFVYDTWLACMITTLDHAQLITTLVSIEHLTFRANRVIIRQGDLADQLYLLVRGEVELLRRDRRGVYEPVALLNAGQCFGEIHLLSFTRHTTAAKAVTDVACVALDRATVTSLVSTRCANNRDDLILCCYLAWRGVPKQPAVKHTAGIEPELARQAALAALDRHVGLLGSLLSHPPNCVGRDVSGQKTLLVMRNAHFQQHIVIDTPQTIVGCSGVQDAGIVVQLDDCHVSPRHLVLNIQPDGLYARDLGSAHGTWVDGQQLGILPVLLRDGAQIRLGPDSVLWYLAGAPVKPINNPLVQRSFHTSAASPRKLKERKGIVASLW